MKQNENTSVKGKNVVLVPYEKHHVLRYHEWMKSPELQELTASEPLSLEEEYAMQSSWREDKDKCTFIVLDSITYNKSEKSEKNEVEAMIGDVNLFFNDDNNKHTAEIEIMIAEQKARGKGCGKEAMYSMMKYAMESLQVDTFTAKISYNNAPSLQLFNKTGFIETTVSCLQKAAQPQNPDTKIILNAVSRSDVFQEVTLMLSVDDTLRDLLSRTLESYSLCTYRT